MARIVFDSSDEERVNALALELERKLLEASAGTATTREAWERLVSDEVLSFRWRARVALITKAVADIAPSLGLAFDPDVKQIFHGMAEELEPDTDVAAVEERIVIWDSISDAEAMCEAELLLGDQSTAVVLSLTGGSE